MKSRTVLILIASFLLCACAGCGDAVIGPDPETTPEAIFDQLWTGFDRYYAPFVDRGVNWDSVGTLYRSAAAVASADEELLAVLCSMLRCLHDQHVWIGRSIDECRDTTIDSGSVFAPGIVQTVYLSGGGGGTAPFFHGRIGDSIGYIHVGAMWEVSEGEWRHLAESALESLEGVSRLILDLRNNGGGDGGNALILAGFFADEERDVLRQQERSGTRRDDFTSAYIRRLIPAERRRLVVPTAVLTNRETVSAGEWNVLALRNLPHVRTFGDTTAGSLGGRISLQLANGWHYSLTAQRITTASGEAFEGRGIPPHVPVALDSLDVEAERDPVIEAALEWLRR